MTSVGWHTPIPDWLYRRAHDAPSVVALETPSDKVTYAELYDFAIRFAGRLQNLDVSPGDKVGLLCSQGLSFARAFHGIVQRRAVTVPLNTRLTTSELAWQIRHAGIQVLVHDDEYSERAHEIQRASGAKLRCLNADEPLGDPVSPAPVEVHLEDPLVVMYTSGTTGVPKGAVITYGNQWFSAINSALQLGLSRTERWLVPMPLFHMGGMSVLVRSVIYGTTAVIHNRFDENNVNRALDDDHITILSVVPVMLQRMLQHRDKGYPETLRCILLGGSAAPRVLLETCQEYHVPVAQSYGLTEANSQVTTLRPEDGLRKLGSSGKPLPLTQIVILNDDGHKAAAGEVGEIAVRGPSVISEYLYNEEATKKAFRDGWFHTGDIGYLDDEGYLYVLDRRNDLIVSGGENIYPLEIENVLASHPAVVDVGVLGMVDETWGQVPVAFVKVTGETGSDLVEELAAHCRERLAGYKVPKQFVIVNQLPRNASGKLLRRKLREWVNHESPHP